MTLPMVQESFANSFLNKKVSFSEKFAIVNDPYLGTCQTSRMELHCKCLAALYGIYSDSSLVVGSWHSFIGFSFIVLQFCSGADPNYVHSRKCWSSIYSGKIINTSMSTLSAKLFHVCQDLLWLFCKSCRRIYGKNRLQRILYVDCFLWKDILTSTGLYAYNSSYIYIFHTLF